MPDSPLSRSADHHVTLITTPVSSLVKREVVALPPESSIREAACVMRDQGVSCVAIVKDGVLFGLLTDRDLRNRVLAAGVSPDRPIVEVATLAPMTIDWNSHAFDALLLMARHNIHHVPVMQSGRLKGMVTASDLTEQQSNSAVYLTGAIYKQTRLQGLVEVSRRIAALQQNLAAAQASAYSTGRIVSAITDALTTRLLQLAELELGPPPVPYAWVAAGSQGRNEQTAKSDQDNCLILDDAYDPAQHGAYFQTLARLVCDGLHACGYVYCPGEMMAITDAWRQPLRQWRAYFREWIHQPDPTALMLTCVFFDQRFVYGSPELLDTLQQEVLQESQHKSVFLSFLVSNALTRRPPLNWLGQITPARRGEHVGTVDLKHVGMVPIIDLARVYGLATGTHTANTLERLRHAAAAGALGEQRVHDLIDAYEFMGALRLQHQARRMGAGLAADNHVCLSELSNFERAQLRQAFSVVKGLQTATAHRYQAGHF